MRWGPSHPLSTSRTNTKERDRETQTCSPSALQCWDHGKAFWRGKGRQHCTFILIQTKGPTLNSLQAPLSLSLKFSAALVFLCAQGCSQGCNLHVAWHVRHGTHTPACAYHTCPQPGASHKSASDHTQAQPVSLCSSFLLGSGLGV